MAGAEVGAGAGLVAGAHAVEDFVGLTPGSYNGSFVLFGADKNGFDDAAAICSKAYTGSHVCTGYGIDILAQGKGLSLNSDFRYVDLSATTDPSTNACQGFTSASNKDRSRCIKMLFGGPIIPRLCPCDQVMPLACCV